MIKELKFSHLKAEEWYDTGSVDSLIYTQNKITPKMLKEVLDKETESIYFRKNQIIKFFAEEKTNLNRVKRSKILKGVVPEVVSYSSNFYKYNFVKGDLYSKKADSTNFEKFLNHYQKNIWINEGPDMNLNLLSKKFYYDKTKERIKAFFNKNAISDSKTIINNIEVPKAIDIINSIPSDFYSKGEKSKIHGDFIIDNAIITKNSFKMIDWRQDFAGNVEYGDTYYDLAKLAHNLVVNHEIVDKNLFSFEHDDNGNINIEILRKQKLVDCENIFFDWLEKNNYNKRRVKILRGLIWLNMSPLHHKPFDYFLFNYGKLNLFKSLNYES